MFCWEMSSTPQRAALSGLALVLIAVAAVYALVWFVAIDSRPAFEIGAEFDPETLEIVWLQPDGPAEKGGLTLHDRVTALDGIPVVNGMDLADRLREAAPGQVIRITVILAGLNLPRAEEVLLGEWERPSPYSWLGRLGRLPLRLAPLLLVVIAAAVLRRQPDRLEAWLVALIAVGMIGTAPLLSFFEKMPHGLRASMLAFKLLSAALAPALLYYLLAIFPERSELDKRYPQIKDAWVAGSLIVALPIAIWGFNARTSGPWEGGWPAAGRWLLALSWLAAMGLGYFALWQCNLDSRSEERRRRARLAGAGIGVALAATAVLWAGLPLPAVAALLTFPAFLGYAVVAREPLPVGVVVRRSARMLLVGRGTRFAFLDRWLFRSVWRTNVILEKLPGQLTFVRNSSGLMETIERELTEAYDPVSLAIYLRSDEETLSARRGKVPNGMQEVRDDLMLPHPDDAGKPQPRKLTIGSLTEVTQLGPDCIVPLRTQTSELLGLVILGARKTGEPYTREDRRRLDRVAPDAGRALQRFRIESDVA
jgi:hypothetical protein